MLLTLLLLFFFGAALGSFTNVLIDRIPRGESVFISRSHCEKCKRRLVWYELIPVVSYIVLRGKCRTCKKRIPFRILFVEVACGIAAVTIFFSLQYQIALYYPLAPFLVFILFCILMAIFFIDLDHMIIPDVLLVAFGIITLLLHGVVYPTLFPEFILSGIFSFLFFLFLFAITKGCGMGLGDVKFSFLIGFLLGYTNTIIALYTAFLTGAFVSIILIMARKKKLRGGTIPFGPFLVLGVVMALIWGSTIAQFLPFHL